MTGGVINLTPHAIKLRLQDGGEIVIPPSGTVARVATVETAAGMAFGLPVVRRVLGAVTGLPANGEPCIVSAMVLAAVPAGTDGVYAPDTGPTAIRDTAGQVVAVTRLISA